MEKIIFVVDDSDTNLAAAESALEDNYTVMTIPSGARCIALLEKVRPHLILLDIEMPEMSGFDVLELLKSNEKHMDIPVVFLTAMSNEENETRALEMGVVDFITKPFSKPVLLNRIKLQLNLSEIIRERTRQLAQAQQDIIYVLADIVENRDLETGGHIDRTARLVTLLIQEMKNRGVYHEQVKDWDPQLLGECSLLHDVGKVNIPDAILNKPGKLTQKERETMMSHSLIGRSIIEKIIERNGGNVFLHHALLFTTYHHERWNGTGYPYGLIGEDIPLQGRVMAIVDVYDALISKRPYKEPFSVEEAMEIILLEKERHFDPLLVDIFLDIKDKFEEIN